MTRKEFLAVSLICAVLAVATVATMVLAARGTNILLEYLICVMAPCIVFALYLTWGRASDFDIFQKIFLTVSFCLLYIILMMGVLIGVLMPDG